MPRRIDDIVPKGRRSISDVNLRKSDQPSSHTTHSAQHAVHKHEAHIKVHVKDEKHEPISSHELVIEKPVHTHKKKSSKGLKLFLITLGIVICIAGLGYIASVYFSRATISIVPKTVPIAINSTYILRGYDVVTLKGVATTSVPAANGSPISTKAQGKITLYNTQVGQSQRLVAGTRLSIDSGKIYRLVSSVVIPGGTSGTVGSSTIKAGQLPGSIVASIIADQPGEAYNITNSSPVSDFHIPAYKGTPKYSAVYGRIRSEITGGFLGTKKIVNQALLASTTASLQTSIVAPLLAQARSALSPDRIMYDSGYVSSFEPVTITYEDATHATVRVRGTVNIASFKRGDLVSQLAGSSTMAGLTQYGYETVGLDSLTFKLVGKTASTSTAVSTTTATTSGSINGSITARIQGNVKLIAHVPKEEIQKRVAGASLADLDKVLSPFNSVIQTVSAELMPQWAKIPNDIKRINIVVAP